MFPTYTGLDVRDSGIANHQARKLTILAYAALQSLHFLAQTWITPDNTATPANLSTSFSHTHTPRPYGRGGGTGLIAQVVIPGPSPGTPDQICNLTLCCAVTLLIKLNIAVIYRQPGPLGDFFNKIDALTCFPEDGTQLDVLGDFNIKPEKLHLNPSPEFINFFATFGLALTPPSTHRAGNQLDLDFTRSCACGTVTPHPLPVSDHLVAFSLPVKSPTSLPTTPHIVTSCRNLKTLSPSTLSATVLSSLPPSCQ